jgi:uncharacterized protein
LAVGVVSLSGMVRGQDPPKEEKEDYVKAHYTKYEYRIRMRDGKRLFTAVYTGQAMSFRRHYTSWKPAPDKSGKDFPISL